MVTIKIIVLSFLFSVMSMASALYTDLVGSEVIPGPGDDDGSGYIALVLKPSKGEVCSYLSVEKIDVATSASVFKGEKGSIGEKVFDLPKPSDSTLFNCVAHISPTIINDMRSRPQSYYVLVNNEEFMKGALRGQLGD